MRPTMDAGAERDDASSAACCACWACCGGARGAQPMPTSLRATRRNTRSRSSRRACSEATCVTCEAVSHVSTCRHYKHLSPLPSALCGAACGRRAADEPAAGQHTPPARQSKLQAAVDNVQRNKCAVQRCTWSREAADKPAARPMRHLQGSISFERLSKPLLTSTYHLCCAAQHVVEELT